MRIPNNTRTEIVNLILSEVERANEMYGPMASTWEAHGIMREEFEELWDEIKEQKRGDIINTAMITECVQLAAMAIKFMESLPWHTKPGGIDG